MKRLRVIPTLFCTALLASTILVPHANAGEWNRKTTVTFSGPVEIPGDHLAGWGVLPAGTYVFKLLNSQSHRHIVQIFNKDENVIYATILAIPNYRLRTSDKTVITFLERPAGQPPAIRAWFYPGRQYGEEFVYPKAKAMELATSTHESVLFTTKEATEVSEPIKSADTADAPAIAEMSEEPVRAYAPTGEEVEMAEVVTPPPPAAMPVEALPATASYIPLIALSGLLALAGALTVGTIKQRIL